VIGHSFGGLSARVFAADHRDDVVGLVLLDTTYPNVGGGVAFAALFRAEALRAHAGLLQLFPADNSYTSLPEGEAAGAFAVTLWTSHRDATADEMDAWDATAAQVNAAGHFGSLPLLVVSVPGPPEHLALQREIATISTESQLVVLDTSHMAMLLERGPATSTAALIRAFVTELD